MAERTTVASAKRLMNNPGYPKTMLFRRKPIPETKNPNPGRSDSESISSQAPSMQSRTSTAHTAHLVGPGCMKLEADMPIWKPVDAPAVKLHPEYLKAIVCYGNVDFSTAVLCKLWHQGTQVVFLTPGGHRLLGRHGAFTSSDGRPVDFVFARAKATDC